MDRKIEIGAVFFANGVTYEICEIKRNKSTVVCKRLEKIDCAEIFSGDRGGVPLVSEVRENREFSFEEVLLSRSLVPIKGFGHKLDA